MLDAGKNVPGGRPAAQPARFADGAAVPERALRRLTDVFKGLADRSRLQILFLLARHGELHVSAIGDDLGQSQPAVSHHLNQLKKAGLIAYRREGKFNYYRLAPEGLGGLVGELFPLADGAPEVRLDFGAVGVAFRRK